MNDAKLASEFVHAGMPERSEAIRKLTSSKFTGAVRQLRAKDGCSL